MTSVYKLILVAVCVSSSLARSAEKSDEQTTVKTVTGTLFAFDRTTGENRHKINSRHLEAMVKDENSLAQPMRLDMGSEYAAIEMDLSRETAWSGDSLVVVRRGEKVEELRDLVDSQCFLSGRLTSAHPSHQGGAVSINRCGNRISGMFHTGDLHYVIDGVEEHGEEVGYSNIKVTVQKSTDLSPYEDLDNYKDLPQAPQAPEEHDRTKRQAEIGPLTAEVAIYLDSNFAKWMADYKGLITEPSLVQWLVMKWNVIRQVMANEQAVGFPFTIQLKKIEIWRENPSYYSVLGDNSKTHEYLNAFCRMTPTVPNYDHKMLYTQGLGEHHMGMAHLNGICRETRQCSLVKSRYDPVKIELHEFGHNLGLRHDPELEPCTNPDGEGGFMGWGKNYRIMDCYKRVLNSKLREAGARCLYQENVPSLPVLNME